MEDWKVGMMDYRTREQTAIELHNAWRLAADQHARQDTPHTMAEEQAAYDGLIDHLEESGLNYTPFDPRGDE